MITIAVSKGYLWNEAIKVLAKIGIVFPEDITETRKLDTIDSTGQVKLLLCRPWDVPTYVENGAATCGIVGKDVLIEQEPNIVELLDLKFGGCRLVLAGPNEMAIHELPHNLKVATKYSQSTERYFRKRGLKVKPLKLYGAIELAPSTGLADVICDLSATGKSLEENQLKVIDTLFESTARLIANTASMKTQFTAIKTLYDSLKAQNE